MQVVLSLLQLTCIPPVLENQGTGRLKPQQKGSAGPIAHTPHAPTAASCCVKRVRATPHAGLDLCADPAASAAASPPAGGSGAAEVNLMQSLFPHAAALMHSCTLHSPGNISVLFNQPCLPGSAVLEHQRDMHIQQRMCPAVQSCWLQIRAGKLNLGRCSGYDTLIPASFPCLRSVRLEIPFPICVTATP